LGDRCLERRTSRDSSERDLDGYWHGRRSCIARARGIWARGLR
jgi:hypothetical protein